MKNLITAVGCILILLVMMVQFINNQAFHDKLTRGDKAVFAFQERLKVEGCILPEMEADLRENLEEVFENSSGDIVIEGTKEPAYKGEEASYKVTLPLDGLLSSFWGTSDDMNYTIRGQVTSQLIDRRSNW